MNKNNHNLFLSADTISEGPYFAEDFSSQALRDFDIKNDRDKYLAMIGFIEKGDMIKGGSKQYTQDFYTGYYYTRAAMSTTDMVDQNALLTKALSYYERLLKSSKGEKESLFFAQLQIGFILSRARQSWGDAEEAFLKAYEIDSERAEPFEPIIIHYLSEQQYTIAYMYSRFAKEAFFSKTHAVRKVWGFDESLYRWKVLDLHIATCYQMGGMQEAAEAYSSLVSEAQSRPESFEEGEIRHIESKRELFKEAVEIC